MTTETSYTITLRCIVESESYEDALRHAIDQLALEDFYGSVFIVRPGETTLATREPLEPIR